MKKQIIVGATLFGSGLLIGLGLRGTVDSQMPVVEVSPTSVPVIETKGEVAQKVVHQPTFDVQSNPKTRTWDDLNVTAEERVELEKIMKSRGKIEPPPQEWVDHVFRGKIKKARRVRNG